MCQCSGRHALPRTFPPHRMQGTYRDGHSAADHARTCRRRRPAPHPVPVSLTMTAQQDLPELAQARQLWALDRHEEALALFHHCAAAHPSNRFALIDAARVSGQWFELDRMETYLQQLLNLSEGRSENRLQAAMTYRMNFRPQQAAALLDRIASSRRVAFLANLELAVLHERGGNLSKAARHAKAALGEVPRNPEASLVLARIAAIDNRADEALRWIESSSRAGNVHPDTLAAGLALRARLAERQGDAAGAFELARRSNAALEPAAQALPAHVWHKDAEIAAFYEQLDQTHVDQWVAWDPADRQCGLCLMSSFPRSGTTLLESMLGAHPDIEAADELPVFTRRLLPKLLAETGHEGSPGPDQLGALDAARRRALRATYFESHAQALDTRLDGRWLLDKNPSLTVFLPMFLRLFPQAKLLMPLRDPRDVVVSCFFQYLPVNPWSVHFLHLETAAQRFARVLGYWVKLRRLLPTQQWLEVRYERLVEQPERELQRTLAFLELPLSDRALDYRASEPLTVHTAPTYADVREPPHQRAVGRWRQYAEHIEPLRGVLEPIMADLGYQW